MMSHNVYIIDSQVADYAKLITQLPANSDWYLLNSDSDGVVQIADILSGYQNLDSIQIISHGSPGAVYLGSATLHSDNLYRYTRQLTVIGAALSDNGDILIYGCKVAAGVVGQDFVNQIAVLTGADVAASTNLTGGSGDWLLEENSGVIEAPLFESSSYTASLATINGTSGNDTLIGTSGIDSISGGDGDDILNGGSGNLKDTLDGGGGNDTLDYSEYTSTVKVEFNLYGSWGAAIEGGNVGDSFINFENATGGSGNDSISGDNSGNVLNGGAGVDSLYGWGGDDTLVGGDGNDILYGNDGSDTADYSAKTSSVSVVMDSANVNVSVRVGSVWEDTITGIENLTGGAGNDLFTGGSERNTFKGGAGNDTLDGGAGLDTADYSDKTVSVSVALKGSTSVQVFVGGIAEDNIKNFECLIGGSGDDNLTGDDLNNGIKGGAGSDTLSGGAQVDTIYGGAGNDAINGGEGFDILDGESGEDTLDYSEKTTSVYVALNGSTQVHTTVSGVTEDVVKNFENVTGGSGNDTLIGDNNNNVMAGGSGNDTLNGGTGSDTVVFTGALSDYRISYDANNLTFLVSDKVSGRDGTDTLNSIETFRFSDGSRSASDFIDTTPPLVSTFSPSDGATSIAVGSNITLTFNEAIQRGSGNIEIRSGSPAGTLVESFDAASSSSLSISGSTLTIDPADNLANSTQYFVTLDAGSVRDLAGNNYAGTSTYDFTTDANYVFDSSEIELILTGAASINGTGNALDNDIAGNSGANTLLGLGGNDTLKGGAGNDVLDGGAGIDTADFSDKTQSVTVNLRTSAMVMARVGNVNEDSLTDIENLIGGSSNDALTGNNLVNVLIGGGGDDTLDGDRGADSLFGGTGNDTFVLDQERDVVIEQAGEGIDLIRTSLARIDLNDYDHVENLTYTGRRNSALIGSDLANIISGGLGTDVIQGGLGSDTLYGGDGSDALVGSSDETPGSSSDRDRLFGGRGNDVYLLNGESDAAVQIIEYRGEGTDTILGDLARYVMTDHVENYVNDRAISQNGTYQFVEIIGNSQNNIIRSSPNWDLIPRSAELDWVATNLKRLMDSTSDFVSSERFFGMAGNDTLSGGAGNDYLSGGAGRDRLTGGAGLDQFVFDAPLHRTSNVDTITDFVRGQDKIVLDRAVFSWFSLDENVADHLSTTGRPFDRDDYLIYNSSTKTLSYDADGNGGGAAVAFAVLTGVSTLSASDFLIM
jgi:Ca2+-binding RTX toxin-like protein